MLQESLIHRTIPVIAGEARQSRNQHRALGDCRGAMRLAMTHYPGYRGFQVHWRGAIPDLPKPRDQNRLPDWLFTGVHAFGGPATAARRIPGPLDPGRYAGDDSFRNAGKRGQAQL